MGYLYDILNTKHWNDFKKNNQIGETDSIAKLDSIMFTILNGHDPQFYESPYLPEEFSDLEQMESKAQNYRLLKRLRDELIVLNKTKENFVAKNKIFQLKNSNLLLRNEILADSILEKNLQAATLDRSLKNKNTELKNLNSNIKELQRENSNLGKAKNSLITTAALFGLLLFFITIKARNNHQKNREKYDNEINSAINKIENLKKEAIEKDLAKKLQKEILLNGTASHHIVTTLIENIPVLIKNSIPKNDTQTLKILDKAINFSISVFSFFTTDFEMRHSLTNTILNEIHIIKEFLRVWSQVIQEEILYDFIYDKQQLNLLEGIEFPKKIFLNFVSNSFRHGRRENTRISVHFLVNQISNGFEIIIQDNGLGFTSLDRDNKKYKGINLAMEQIKFYNEEANNPYRISFSKDNIENIFSGNDILGVRVTLKLLKNETEITNSTR